MQETYAYLSLHTITTKTQELRHNISEHLGSHFHCIVTLYVFGFIALCVLAAHWYMHMNTHNFCVLLLAFGSLLPPRFYRWAWSKDSRAGLESV